MKKLNADEEFKAEYEYWLKYEREKYLHQKKGFIEGKADGIAQGLAQGKAEGLAQGEIQAKIELAVKLIKISKMSLEEAIAFCGLDKCHEEKIKNLLSQKSK